MMIGNDRYRRLGSNVRLHTRAKRRQNADVIKLGKAISEFKKNNPGVKVPYERR